MACFLPPFLTLHVTKPTLLTHLPSSAHCVVCLLVSFKIAQSPSTTIIPLLAHPASFDLNRHRYRVVFRVWVCLVSAVQCWFWNTDKVSLLKLDPLSQFSCDICPACSHTFNKTELFFKMMSSTAVVHILFPSPVKAMQQKYVLPFQSFHNSSSRPDP